MEDDDLFLSFEPYPTAKSLMDALTAWFLSTSMPRRMVLFRKYAEHRMSEDVHINQDILEMGVMARELEMAGVPVFEDLQMVVLMNSLPESWRPVIGMIVHMDKEELTLANVSQRLRIVGELRGWRAGNNDPETGPSNKKPKRASRVTVILVGSLGIANLIALTRIDLNKEEGSEIGEDAELFIVTISKLAFSIMLGIDQRGIFYGLVI